jgi:hypothetical protein
MVPSGSVTVGDNTLGDQPLAGAEAEGLGGVGGTRLLGRDSRSRPVSR